MTPSFSRVSREAFASGEFPRVGAADGLRDGAELSLVDRSAGEGPTEALLEDVGWSLPVDGSPEVGCASAVGD
jgi:hypothetical protein